MGYPPFYAHTPKSSVHGRGGYPRPGAAPYPPVRGRPRALPSGGGRVSPRPGAAACPPVRGRPRAPPSRTDPGPPPGRTPKVQNVFRFKLDAKSIPEALATTFRILEKFSIDLAHRYPGRRRAPQNRPRTPPTPPQSDPRLTV